MKHAWIDATRGLAILMVLIDHAIQGMPTFTLAGKIAPLGAFGVQLFFVASACTLCMSWEKRRDELCSVRAFFARRFFRIAPMYYVGILVYGCGSFFDFPLGNLGRIGSFGERYSPVGVMANVAFVHGFSFEHYNNIVPGGWSIGTEMLFYGVFIPVFGLCATNKWSVSRILVGYSLVLVALISYLNLACDSFTVLPNQFWFSSIIVQFPAFLCGFRLYGLIRQPGANVPRIHYGTATLSLCILAVCWKASSMHAYPGPIAACLYPLFAGLTFVGLCLWLSRNVTTTWGWCILGYIGKISFSLYVVHFIFAWDAGALLRLYLSEWINRSFGLPIAAMHVLLTLALSMGLATMTFYFIERPGIKLGERMIARLAKRGTLMNQPL